MLTEPLSSQFRSVPCANPDVIYGFALLDLEQEPVVLQVPESVSKTGLIQLGDHRTDSFGELGSMYGSRPGFYLIVGPNWQGEKPDGFHDVFRSPTNLAYAIPRYFAEPGKLAEIQNTIRGVAAYPYRYFTGGWKLHNWDKKKWYPVLGETTKDRCKQVNPRTYFESLRTILDEVPALPGEEDFYKELSPLLDRLLDDSDGHESLRSLGENLETKLIAPCFDFRNVGTPLPNGWTTVTNAANFGTDYMTRAAVAKSNIFVNRPREAKYFYLEVDRFGGRLNGENDYEIVLDRDKLPPNRGFWSLTVYNQHHHLVGSEPHTGSFVMASHEEQGISRGNIQIVLSSTKPEEPCTAWIKTPQGPFTLYLRVYSPEECVAGGEWSPPAVSILTHSYFAAN